jgi:hypothetical protein
LIRELPAKANIPISLVFQKMESLTYGIPDQFQRSNFNFITITCGNHINNWFYINKMDPVNLVSPELWLITNKLLLPSGLLLMMETLFLLTGVLKVLLPEMMDLRLLNTLNLHMKVRKNIDQLLLLRDLHSTQIFFWRFITSTFLFGKLILIITKNQFSIQLHLSTLLTTRAVLSPQLDQVWFSSPKPTV